jgi:hypothetical protein
VGADNTVTSCDLRIFVDQAAKPVTSPDVEVVVGRCDVSPVDGWFLAEGPVRPAGVVVIDVFPQGVVQLSSAGDEDPVGALAPRTADPRSRAARVRNAAQVGPFSSGRISE